MTSRVFVSSLCIVGMMLVNSASGQNKLPTPTVPKGFKVTIYAKPPQINYPVCLTAAPTGEVFVGIDKQGSLGKKKGDGRVERCIDTDGDGVADKFNTFAKMDHPRGLIYDNGKLWVLHPPNLTLYHDDDKDGKADRKETLVTGLTTGFLNKRGADHTTNGIRMGIDGWIYIAVGDFGFFKAKGKDGRELTLKGGGVVRVRPDGTEMEIFCRGLRNILDVCIDPRLNMFARDNTNDGGGWDIRLFHVIQSANYGYPSLFKNFADEALPPLADYGGGSGCGGMFLSEGWMPGKFRNSLLTCDWGRGAVFFHPLKHSGASYKAGQEEFVKISRPTDIDTDGAGGIYISSWHGGQFSYKGENVGFVAQVRPTNIPAQPHYNISKIDDMIVGDQLHWPSHMRRIDTQREILRRGPKPGIVRNLKKLMRGFYKMDARVAAIFTYKQMFGAEAIADLVKLAQDSTVREFALRALTDRKSQLQSVPVELFVKSLKDKNPRVQLAALIGLGRLGNRDAAKAILPLTQSPKSVAAKVQPAAYRSGILKGKKRSVKIKVDIKGAKKLFLVVTDAGDGNGLDHVAWVQPVLAGPKGKQKITELKWTSAKAGWGGVHVHRDCQNKPLRFKGKPVADGIGTHAHSVLEYDLPLGYTTFQARGILDDGSNGRGSVRFYVFTNSLPTTYQKTGGAVVKDISKYVLPHVAVKTLVEINAIEECVKALNGPHRQGASMALRYMHDPKTVKGLIEQLNKTRVDEQRLLIAKTLIRLFHKEAEYTGTWWGTRPDTTGPYYHRAVWQLTPTIETVLRNELTSAPSRSVEVLLAELARHRVTIQNLPPNLAAKAKTRNVAPNINVAIPKFDKTNPKLIGNMPFATVLSRTLADKGDLQSGIKLFKRQSCHACHTTKAGERPLGPPLIDISKRYNRKQMIESILKPSALIAQGFASYLFVMKDGKSHTGFVVREAADEVEIRTNEGKSGLLPRKMIDERIASKQSIMPEGLANNLTVEELASLLAYLESLKKD